MHEEDVGVLWKHQDFFSGTSEVRRSRRLVVSFWAAIGNYDYGFFWYLYQDGTIEFDIKLTGIVFAVATHERRRPRRRDHARPGRAVPPAPVQRAPRHDRRRRRQHASRRSTSSPSRTTPPTPTATRSPTRTTVIEREADAARLADAGTLADLAHRQHGTRRNAVGRPVGYKLVPWATRCCWPGPARAWPSGPPSPRDTCGSPATTRPSGTRPATTRTSTPAGPGCPAFQAADRSLVDEDVVVWHTFGSTHIPRTEDWPVMPVEHAGFLLKPVNFFDRNPALDLPRSSPGSECSVETDGSCH